MKGALSKLEDRPYCSLHASEVSLLCHHFPPAAAVAAVDLLHRPGGQMREAAWSNPAGWGWLGGCMRTSGRALTAPSSQQHRVLSACPRAQVGGWTVEHQGLTFASVRGAGHMVRAGGVCIKERWWYLPGLTRLVPTACAPDRPQVQPACMDTTLSAVAPRPPAPHPSTSTSRCPTPSRSEPCTSSAPT